MTHTHSVALSDALADIRMLRFAASQRAATPPRITEDAWRGPAFQAYAMSADGLADELRAFARELHAAERLLTREVLDAPD